MQRIWPVLLLGVAAALFLLCGKKPTSPPVAPVVSRPVPDSIVSVPGGTFHMGADGDIYQQPVHTVFLNNFVMSNTEVTQKEYHRVMNVNPSLFTDDSTLPVEQVTWFDAVLYCNRRSVLENRDTVYSYAALIGAAGEGCTGLPGLAIAVSKNGYRLPTEAEWEYSCRAGTTTEYYWGALDAADYAWYYPDSDNRTHPVGAKAPNRLHLYDMSGNVWEWCNDWYGGYDSTGQTNPLGPAAGTERVLRGGSWSLTEEYLKSGYRYKAAPSQRSSIYGFRIVHAQ